MRIRIAKQLDAPAIARLYKSASDHLDSGFVMRLGLRFLQLNYEMLMSERYGIVLCLEDPKKRVVGFVSGSLEIEEHFENLSRKRLQVGLSCFEAFLRNPSLIRGALHRLKSVRQKSEEAAFVAAAGPRLEFWACDTDAVSGPDAILLLKAWLAFAESAGVSEVACEVDEVNKRVLKVHLALGAQVVEKFVTSDGRQRFLLKYVFGTPHS